MAIVRFEPEEHEAALAAGFVHQARHAAAQPAGQGRAHRLHLQHRAGGPAAAAGRGRGPLLHPRPGRAEPAARARAPGPPSASACARPFPIPSARSAPTRWCSTSAGADELPGQIYEQIFAHKPRLVVQSPADRKQVRPVFAAGLHPAGRVSRRSRPCCRPPRTALRATGCCASTSPFPSGSCFLSWPAFRTPWPASGRRAGPGHCCSTRPDTRLEGRVDKSCFELFCTPVINLFEKTLDRILISDRFSEFHVVPDRNRPLDFEVYQVDIGHRLRRDAGPGAAVPALLSGPGHRPGNQRLLHRASRAPAVQRPRTADRPAFLLRRHRCLHFHRGWRHGPLSAPTCGSWASRALLHQPPSAHPDGQGRGPHAISPWTSARRSTPSAS